MIDTSIGPKGWVNERIITRESVTLETLTPEGTNEPCAGFKRANGAATGNVVEVATEDDPISGVPAPDGRDLPDDAIDLCQP